MKKGLLTEFAVRVGITRERAGQLRRAGHLTGETFDELLLAYCSHLREQAAGRQATGDIDLPTERALLAQAQRLKLEREAQVARRELVAADDVITAWTRLVGACRSRLLAIPSRMGSLHGAEVAANVEMFVFEALDELSSDGLPADKADA